MSLCFLPKYKLDQAEIRRLESTIAEHFPKAPEFFHSASLVHLQESEQKVTICALQS